MKRTFRLIDNAVKQRAMAELANTPVGCGKAVSIQDEGRSQEQNSALWPMLEHFSKQLQWPVNGQMCTLDSSEWKDILSSAYRQETARIAMGLTGGMVMLGMRTSKMSKREFSEFLEFIQATAADRGVDLQ